MWRTPDIIVEDKLNKGDVLAAISWGTWGIVFATPSQKPSEFVCEQ